MGYREWRERQGARIDAMTARADERVARAVELESEQRASVAAAREARAADAADAQSSWAEGRARVLGEDHQSLMARAAAVGMGGPSPARPRQCGGGVLGAVGELVVMDGAGVHGEPRDPYREWRDRIVVEEMCAAKVARGEALSALDRASLRAARLSSR